MSSDGSKELQQYFIRFWHFSERAIVAEDLALKPLFGVRAHWRHWLAFDLTNEEQRHLCELLAGMPEESQEEFIKWIGDYANRLSLPSGAARVILGQLASLAQFESWKSLESFAFGNTGRAVNAIILRPGDSWHSSDVRPLEVALLTKEHEKPNYKMPNWQASEVALENVRAACLSLLDGPGRLNVVFCWLFAWRPQRRLLFYGLLAGAWLSVIFLLSPVSTQLDALVPVSAWLLVILAILMVCIVVNNVIAEFRIARRWAELLNGNDIYAAMGNLKSDQTIKVDGASFGVSMALAVLLALHKKAAVAPRRSWFLERGLESIASRTGRWSLTGGLEKSGRVSDVQRLFDKIAASEANPEISDMLIPSHLSIRPRFLQPVAAWILFALSGAQMTASGNLRVHRTGHLVQSILTIGGLVSKRALLANTLLVSLLILVAYAFSDIRSIVIPPAGPEFINKKCLIENRPDGSRLLLYFATSNPAYFKVRLSSSYWADREVTLEPAPKLSGVGEAEIGLFRLDRPATADSFEGEVELRRPRRFLWREYAPVSIERDTLRHILSR